MTAALTQLSELPEVEKGQNQETSAEGFKSLPRGNSRVTNRSHWQFYSPP